jgi:hypothetical protein
MYGIIRLAAFLALVSVVLVTAAPAVADRDRR